jgi:hypothetical protein
MSGVACYEAKWYEENPVGWQQVGETFARSHTQKGEATLLALQVWELCSIHGLA